MVDKVFLLITKAEMGGAQMSVLNLARGLRKRGVTVQLGFGEGEFLAQEAENLGIKYNRFKNLRRSHNPLLNLFFILEVKRFFDRNHFDVVHINSSNALLAGLGVKLSKNKTKTVFTFRGMSMLDKNYLKHRILKYFYRLYFKIFLKYIDEAVFVSKQNLDLGKSLSLVKKYNLIYNGLDKSVLNFYTQDQARQELLPESKDTFLIGSIGRLAYQKNYSFLIDVFPELLKIKQEAKFLIIGDGPERKSCEELIRKKGLESKVFLLGNIDKASRYLRAFDLFVLPSRYEGLSITLIETLFAGVPVLASDVGGNKEVLPSKDSLYELNNKDDFLEKFKVLSMDKEKRKKMAERNLEFSDNFLLQNTVFEYLEIYNKKL